MQFTKPLITSHALFTGGPTAGNGTLIVVNSEGWFLSAAHMFSAFMKAQADAPEVRAHFSERQRIESDSTLDEKHRRRQLNKLNPKNDWVVSASFWWCVALDVEPIPLRFSKLIVAPAHDLALGKFESFNPDWVAEYPAFKTSPLAPGTSLCRLGFPFTSIKLDVDHNARTIDIDVSGLSYFQTRACIRGPSTRERTKKDETF